MWNTEDTKKQMIIDRHWKTSQRGGALSNRHHIASYHSYLSFTSVQRESSRPKLFHKIVCLNSRTNAADTFYLLCQAAKSPAFSKCSLLLRPGDWIGQSAPKKLSGCFDCIFLGFAAQWFLMHLSEWEHTECSCTPLHSSCFFCQQWNHQ